MLFIDNQNEHDPAVNLALEEYIHRQAQTDEDLLLFYINAPSIIIGRHQNTLEEINRDYVEQHGIHIVRRLSGGGAVYHDLGNLNFSFITRPQPGDFHNFKKFTEPIIRSLAKLGVPAELSGRNDILVDGRKVSGNAQYMAKSRIISHGTLLFSTDLAHVSEALNVQENKLISKGIKSVRSRVANISEFLSSPLDIETFRTYLLANFFEGFSETPRYPLSEQDWAAVHQLADERYRSWEWTYGHSPDFNLEKRQRFPGGEIEARLDVQQGVIRSVKFYGDFFSEVEPEALEQLLIGVRYNREDIFRILQDVEIGRYFSGLDWQTFGAFLF
ncbi:MAG: lipoate--protein ligase [Anaerolineaceae bacterium]|nr:lipoate--protein ligase [Anaerolineaceae bacterium]